MCLSYWGEILKEELEKTATIRKEIEISTYQIMPNHLHAIVIILDGGSQTRANGMITRPDKKGLQRKPHSLGSFVGGLKSAVTVCINTERGTPRNPVWQRSYFDRIIQNEAEWEKMLAYIEMNPLNWGQDSDN